jgi:hypothetical protein
LHVSAAGVAVVMTTAGHLISVEVKQLLTMHLDSIKLINFLVAWQLFLFVQGVKQNEFIRVEVHYYRLLL